MAGSTTKKAIVERFEKEPLAGYLNPVSFLQPAGIELLSEQGNLTTLPYGEIKTVSFVREFGAASASTRRVFLTRPKMEGLWVRLQFRNGEIQEGVLPNNLLQVEYYGFTLIPPDSIGSNHKLFVPRSAVRSVEVMGVGGSPLTRRKPKVAAKEKFGLFEE